LLSIRYALQVVFIHPVDTTAFPVLPCQMPVQSRQISVSAPGPRHTALDIIPIDGILCPIIKASGVQQTAADCRPEA